MKLLIVVITVFLLSGCTNTVEENKHAYLSYKHTLQQQETFSKEEEIDFNTYFNIGRENDEIINYSLVINNPKINMYEVKALLIHDYTQDEVYPSVGILSEPVELHKDTEDNIVLKGTIQTTEDISNIKYKLYIEYKDENNDSNKIYYKLSRG